MNNRKKAGLYTLGCKVSLYETEAISEELERRGFEIAPFDSVCDVYVINTCTVTAESDAKSRKYIRRAVRKNPDAAVIVVGCYSQRAPSEVAAIDGVYAVIGTQDKLAAADCAERFFAERERARIVSVTPLDGAEFEKMRIERAPRTRAYVKIEDGCECKCTYCAISGARGPVRSKTPHDVIDEVEGLYSLGVREIVLTGIETGSYGTDLDEKYTLADLLCELDARHSCERIRLGSMAPELLGKDFIDRVSKLSILVPHFHISMQSASDRVLRAMKRRYSREMALANIERIKENIPGVMLTADLMVGFPGESEEDFLQTLSFVSEAELLDAHVFAYSKREGTPAAYYDGQIPESVKHERSARLIAEVERVRDLVLDCAVRDARPLPCIFESRAGEYFSAHSDSYIEVRAESERDIRGELHTVIPLRHEGGIVYGKLADDQTDYKMT